MSDVTDMQQRLGESIGDIFSGIGQDRLQRAQGEQESKLFDIKYEPVVRERQRRLQPVKAADLIGENPFGLAHWVATDKRDGKTMFDAVAEGMGSKFIADKKAPNAGMFIKDGRPLNQGEFEDNAEKVAGIINARTDPVRLVENERDFADVRMRIDKNPEAAAKWQEKYNKAEQLLSDPAKKAALIDYQISLNNRFVGRGYGIKEMNASLEKKREQIWKRHYEDLKAKGETDKLEELRAFHQGTLENQRARIRAERARGDKDPRGPFGKLVDDYLRIGKFIDPKYTLADAKRAAEAYQNDPRVSSALQQMLTSIDNSYDLSPADKKALKKEIYSGLKEIANRHAGPNKKEDPLGIR